MPTCPPPPPASGGRIPALLMSVPVPGYGAVWAGKWLRGLLWFLAVSGSSLFAMFATVLRDVEFSMIAIAWLVTIVLSLAMLWDCCRPGKFTVGAWCFFGIGFALTCLMAILFIVGCRGFRVAGSSMEPTLHGGRTTPHRDLLVVERFSYLLGEPRRGDIVVYRTDGLPLPRAGGVFVHRVVGLPGDTIEIEAGKVFADGHPLGPAEGLPEIRYLPRPDEPATANSGFLPPTGTYLVPPDSYFVLGDNSAHSLDSRYFGPVAKRNFIGRVAWILLPASRTGKPR